MAQQIKASIEVEGKKIAHYSSVVIVQDVYQHHHFTIEVPFEVLEKKDEVFFQNAHKDICGKSLSISFEPVLQKGSFNFRFKGIITQIKLCNANDLSNSFIIKGYSPDFLLEDTVIKRSFLNKSLQQIFETVLGSYPGNILKKQLKPNYKPAIKYAVQYNESNYEFLSRLADEYGEWFFYNGQEIVLGDPGGGKEFDFLINGIQTFDMLIALRTPPKFQMKEYDYVKHTSYKGKSAGSQVEGLGAFGKFALDESESLFSQDSFFQPKGPVYSQNELDDLIKIRRSAKANQMIVFQGFGENPDLTVGTVINAIGTRLEKGEKIRKENLGKYRIIDIAHSLDSTGNYTCQFNAIPETAKVAPANMHIKQPVGHPELATVTDNNDLDKLGRVKVEFNWPGNDKSSDWIRVGTFYAGGGDSKGMQFIPEKQAQVVVGYELNRPERPFIITSLYPKETGLRPIKGNNEEKFIYTKAGNQIHLIDKQGETSIQITNENNNSTNIFLEFKDKGQITIKTKGKVIIDAQNDISIKAGEKITMEAKDIQIKASNEFHAEGTSKVSLSGAQVKMEADSTMEIKGGASAKVSGPMAEVSSDGILTLKGSMVKIN